jgi:hypothetical protein
MSYAFDESDGRLWIALNPRIAEAILGHRPFTRIEMSEVRKLQSNCARLIHQRLCGWIAPGKTRLTKLDTLCSYVWPSEANVETMKKRRQAARKAMTELMGAGWKVSEYAKGKWEINRPGGHGLSRTNAPHSPY